jgi:hypothetical protein
MVFNGIKWDTMGIYGRLLIFDGRVKPFCRSIYRSKDSKEKGQMELTIWPFLTLSDNGGGFPLLFPDYRE